MPTEQQALPGRDIAIVDSLMGKHFINGRSILPPYEKGLSQAVFGLGCFWGAERKFWQLDNIYATAVGYAAGITPNPTYEEVCSGKTGHNEVVLVLYDETKITYATLLRTFWESHNPTQGMRQGNDRGTQYRSGIYYYTESQKEQAEKSLLDYQQKLSQAGFEEITTEIQAAGTFYYAEEYHQQYLAKNPNGYCGLGGTGINC